MKTIALVLCTTFMLCSLSTAQEPSPPRLPIRPTQPSTAQPLSEDYLVTLTVTDKEQKTSELSLVVASADFHTSFLDALSNVTSFAGTLTPETNDDISIKYALGSDIAVPMNGGTQYKSVATQATVRLKLGEPVQILKSGAQTCTLSVSRLSDQHTKTK